jgi:hypothetical protein
VRDAARGDLDQHVAEHGPRVGHVLDGKPADAGRFVDPDGLHRKSLPWTAGAFEQYDEPTQRNVR